MRRAVSLENRREKKIYIVQRLRITFSSDCAFCDVSTKIGTLVVLYNKYTVFDVITELFAYVIMSQKNRRNYRTPLDLK